MGHFRGCFFTLAVGRGAEDTWTFLRPDVITEGPEDMGRRFRLSFVYSEKLNQARLLGLQRGHLLFCGGPGKVRGAWTTGRERLCDYGEKPGLSPLPKCASWNRFFVSCVLTWLLVFTVCSLSNDTSTFSRNTQDVDKESHCVSLPQESWAN